jgi:hypothetical protein
MTFDEWISHRQDARTWTEDERASAELTWREATKITDGQWQLANDVNKNRISDLEREVSWLEHENWNLKNTTRSEE